MLLLIRYVCVEGLQVVTAHRERGIPFLPLKLRVDRLADPRRRGLLDFSNEVSRRVYGLQADQEMDMISHTSDLQRHAAETADAAAKVFVKPWAPVVGNERIAVFRREDGVVMEADVC